MGLLIGLIIAIVVTGFYPEYTNLYRQGQIDAISGKILFELEVKPDGSAAWERKQ